MKISKNEVLKLLKGEGNYASDNFSRIRLAITDFYSKLNQVNTDRQDFYIKSTVPASGVPAQDLTQNDFLGAFSRLMYGNNVCLALSFFKGDLLVATNKEDYSSDVLLPNLVSNYNNICRYVEWIANLSNAAHRPVWVESKLVGCTHIHEGDGLAGNLASAIAAKIALCRGGEDVLRKISVLVQTRGGEAKDLMQLLDDAKPFEESWVEVVDIIESQFGVNSEEARICRDFTTQYVLEKELQTFKDFSIHILSDFFAYKTIHHSGDIVTGWRDEYNTKCPSALKPIYKKVKAEIRDFLRDLLILESFASRHYNDDDLIKLIRGVVADSEDSSSDSDDLSSTTTQKPKILVEYEQELRKAPKTVYLQLKIIDDEGNAISDAVNVFSKYVADTASSNILEIEGMRAGDVHAEMKILQYQLKNGGLSSYIAISKLCCAFCHLTLDSIDQGSKDHYPGYHGKNYPLRLSDWMKQNLDFLKQLLGNDAFTSYNAVKDIQITLENGVEVNAGELALLLIETTPKLIKELPGFVQIPQGIEGTSESADNSFLIDFGIVNLNRLERQYYSLKTRDFIEQPDHTSVEISLIRVPDTSYYQSKEPIAVSLLLPYPWDFDITGVVSPSYNDNPCLASRSTCNLIGKPSQLLDVSDF
jgi:hypothetical protein